MYLRLIFLSLCLFVPAPAVSQDGPTDAEKLEEAMQVLTLMEQEKKVLETDVQPSLDPKVRAAVDAYNESWVGFFDHQKRLRDHAISVLQWQLLAAYCVTFLVLGIVALGIYLSIIEVKAVLRKPKDLDQKILTEDTQSTVREKIELTVSLQKLQVTSAVTGVGILVLSLGFLYLFVKEVFEIKPQNFSAQAVPAELPKDDYGVAAGGEEAKKTKQP